MHSVELKGNMIHGRNYFSITLTAYPFPPLPIPRTEDNSSRYRTLRCRFQLVQQSLLGNKIFSVLASIGAVVVSNHSLVEKIFKVDCLPTLHKSFLIQKLIALLEIVKLPTSNSSTAPTLAREFFHAYPDPSGYEAPCSGEPTAGQYARTVR